MAHRLPAFDFTRRSVSKTSKRKRVLGTTRRGRTKITSPKEIRYLEAQKLPYTRITKRGKKVRRNADPKRRRGLTW